MLLTQHASGSSLLPPTTRRYFRPSRSSSLEDYNYEPSENSQWDIEESVTEMDISENCNSPRLRSERRKSSIERTFNRIRRFSKSKGLANQEV